MVVDLRDMMGPDGVVRIADLAARTSSTSVSRRVREGRLVRSLPHVVVLPEAAGRWRTRAATAVLSTRGVLSHATALALWDLAEPGDACTSRSPRAAAAPTPPTGSSSTG